MIPVSRFTAYRQFPPDEKRRKEMDDLQVLLGRLNGFMKLDDVQLGQPPHEPDFIFHHQAKRIGVELTDLDPQIFEKHGYVQRGKFKAWREDVKPSVIPERFDWGTYTLRESLAALRSQLDGKRKKAKNWFNNFPERWLLLHVANGSPFSQILGGKHCAAPGRENEVADFLAKSAHGVHAICQDIQPFDRAILFMQDGFLAFPANPANSYKLPVLGDEILKRGAQAPDRFLDWSKNSRTVIEAVS